MNDAEFAALNEKRLNLGAKMKEFVEKNLDQNEWRDASCKDNWEALNRDYDDLKKQISDEYNSRARQVDSSQIHKRIQEASAPLESRARNPISLPEERSRNLRFDPVEDSYKSFAGWLLPAEQRSAVHAESAQRIGFNLDSKALFVPQFNQIEMRNIQTHYVVNGPLHARSMISNDQIEKRAMSTVISGSGGTTVPVSMWTSIEMALLDYGGMRQVAEIVRTQSGENMIWPTWNDTANKGQIVNEFGVMTAQDGTTGSHTLRAHNFTSGVLIVNRQLLDDSPLMTESFLTEAMTERVARMQATKFTVGTGVGEPMGIVNSAALGKTAASASTIAIDEMIDLHYSVDPAYRRDPSFGFMMHDTTIQELRKKKDTTNQYLWQPTVQAGAPDRFLGVPIFANNDMPTIATGAKTVLCGKFRAYKIREVGSPYFQRLNEAYAVNNQVGFIYQQRYDGLLITAGNPVKYLVQA